MKLKSKLIATIVSICAAIAVMGVGVWAATSNFTVTVENTVNIDFSNLAGTVKVSTSATIDSASAGYNELTDQIIFNSADTANESLLVNNAHKISSSATGDGTEYKGADLFVSDNNGGKITATTESAVLQYTFVFDPEDASTGYTNVTVQMTDLPTCTGASMIVEIIVDAGGAASERSTVTDATNGIIADTDYTFSAVGNKIVTVIVRCTYSNPTAVSTNATSAWNFTVDFANNTAAASGDNHLTLA